jgi:hypothetical protein
MARIRRSKTNNTFFMDIPKDDEKGRCWKRSIELLEGELEIDF